MTFQSLNQQIEQTTFCRYERGTDRMGSLYMTNTLRVTKYGCVAQNFNLLISFLK